MSSILSQVMNTGTSAQFSAQDLASGAALLAAQAAQQQRGMRHRDSRGSLVASKREVHVAVNDDEYGVYAIQSQSRQVTVTVSSVRFDEWILWDSGRSTYLL